MAYEENVKSYSANADATLGIYTGPPGGLGSAVPNSGRQFRFVKVTGVNQVGLATATVDIVGVLQNKPQVPGQAATVANQGITLVEAGAAVSAGQLLGADSNGRAIPEASTGKLRALTTAGGSGELVSAVFVANA